MYKKSLLILLIGLLSFSNSVYGEERSADPAEVSPQTYKIILDNDYIRMLEITAKPGERDEMHSHPQSAWYAVSSSKIRLHNTDGSTKDIEVQAGTANFQDAVAMHSMENIGETDAKIVMVELKDNQPPVLETKGPDPLVVSPDVYRLLSENETVRILELTTRPGQRDKMHGHPANVYYVLSGKSGKLYNEHGEVKELSLTAGMASYQDAAQNHQFENSGDLEIKVIMFELKSK
ncbi:MAG: cupin domain-containing protein [Candidatus Dadabacteria bacterium]|nr:cupin domain-containing protein [Candidatus Dadabacteria bacterium]NIS08241.1 cupin domain-containing protein [Candidatus Dadabacteria bacterium]NIV41508.1 cupin domain-containing protein [Candidatus Dadabacteria bacterium]NIY21729.1 cupin domain-containing protein [Candidatus Dadabacteria bacterium]